jgi:hypothetical protein
MAPQEPARATPLDQWHVAINDVPVGPMKREEIARKVATGAVTGDSLAWREGFDDWRPLREIAELAALLRRTAHESQPPRAGAPRAPAPASAPRAGAPRAAAPAPGRPLAPAPRPGAAAARSNVVPIGGRLGASAAPSLDLEDGEGEEQRDAEATTVASAADLGLADFGRSVRDDGAIPDAATAKERAEPAAKTEEKKAPAGLKPMPPPGARPIAAPPKAAMPAPGPAAKAPVAKPPADEPDTLIGAPLVAEPAPAKRGSFAPPPPAAPLAPPPAAEPTPFAAPLAPPPAAAPLAPPHPAVPAAQPAQRQGGGLGVGALMGIGFAMAAGAVLMYGVVQRFILTPAAPAPTVAVATVQPAPTTAPAQHEATVDVTPPPPSAPPPSTAEVAPPPSSTVAAAPTEEHHHTGSSGTSATPPPSSGARAATKTAATDSRFAAFSDEGSGGPARIDMGSEGLHSDTSGSHAAARAELTAEQISEVRRTGQRSLTQCWETALRAAGRVDSDVRYDIDITIGSSGRVTVVHARGPVVGGLADCLERSVRRWAFPPSSGETQTTFPIVFSAQH